MATLKQIEANRLNAQRSTGPRSEAGRTASAQNSRKHGCYAGQVVIEGQDQAQFNQLLDEYMEEYQPQGLRERHLVEMMATEWWHLGQCEFMRQSFFSHQRKMIPSYHANWAELSEAERTNLVGENIAFYHLKDMNRISELKNRVTRSYHRASREFDRVREERLRREAEAAPQAGEQPEPQPLPPHADVPVEPPPDENIRPALSIVPPEAAADDKPPADPKVAPNLQPKPAPQDPVKSDQR
jgi:hypothetical protein